MRGRLACQRYIQGRLSAGVDQTGGVAARELYRIMRGDEDITLTVAPIRI